MFTKVRILEFLDLFRLSKYSQYNSEIVMHDETVKIDYIFAIEYRESYLYIHYRYHLSIIFM